MELVNYGKKSIDHIDKSSRREQFWYTCKWVCKGSKRSILSFKPEVYEKIKSRKKKFEHRRNFPDEPIMAYMYVSAPIKAIKGIVLNVYTHLEAGNIKEQFFNMAQSKQYNFYSLDRAPAVVLLNNEDYDEEPEPDFNEEADDED